LESRGRLYVTRSTGVRVGCVFNGPDAGVQLRDCMAPPPANLAEAGWQHAVVVEDCSFEGTGINGAVMAIGSKAVISRNRFKDMARRGIELQRCRECQVRNNELVRIGDAAILFFDSTGDIWSNTIGGGVKTTTQAGSAAVGTGIYVGKETPGPPIEATVEVTNNVVESAGYGIVVFDARANLNSNQAKIGQIGIILVGGANGTLDGNCVSEQSSCGILVARTRLPVMIAGGYYANIEDYALFIAYAQAVTVKGELQPYFDANHRSGNRGGGLHIYASSVTLEHFFFQDFCEGPSLLVEAGSIVECPTGAKVYGEGTGPGAVVDASTLRGRLSATAVNLALEIDNGSTVVSTGNVRSESGYALRLAGQSSLEMNGEDINGEAQRPGPATDTDVAWIGGGSKIQLTGVHVHNPTGTVLRLTGGSQGVFNNCFLSGSRTLEHGEASGPDNGLVVEGSGTTARIVGGETQFGGPCGIRVTPGGQASLNNVPMYNSACMVWVEPGGAVELTACKLAEFRDYGVRIDSAGQALIRNCDIGRYGTTIRVGAAALAEITGCTFLKPVQVETGAQVTQSGNHLTDGSTSVVESLPGGNP
jgi:hypothetical protein